MSSTLSSQDHQTTRMTVTMGKPVHHSVRVHIVRFQVSLYPIRTSEIDDGWLGHVIAQLGARYEDIKYRLSFLIQTTVQSRHKRNTHMCVHSSRRCVENSID